MNPDFNITVKTKKTILIWDKKGVNHGNIYNPFDQFTTINFFEAVLSNPITGKPIKKFKKKDLQEYNEIDDFPMDTHISIPVGSSIFRYKVTTTNNMISVSATTDLKQSLVDPAIYEELKYFMEFYISKLQEPVVLKKIRNTVALEN